MYRTIKDTIAKNIDSPNVLILLGPRQVGKTTILKSMFTDKAIYIDLDDKVYRDFFDSLSIVKYRSHIDSNLGAFGSVKKEKIILILDEAQRLKDPGLAAKIFYDEIPNVKVILTGSSSLDIKKKTTESLAGRKTTIFLYPLSFQEYLVQSGNIKEEDMTNGSLHTQQLNDIKQNELTTHLLERMRVGLYPGVLQTSAEEYLKELVEAVILKDIFYLNLVKNTSGIVDLLRLLASLIGESINVSDLSKRLGIARQTITDYITILEKSHIIFTLQPYKKDRVDEIGKYSKIYFYDLGIRNALLNDFRPVNMRTDFENIFKNFIITEIKKLNTYYQKRFDMLYWKTTQGSEIDVVLEKDGILTGIDIHLYKDTFSKGFENTYPNAEQYTISLNNFWEAII